MIPQMNFTIYGIGLMAVGEGVRVWSLLLEYVEYMGGMLTRGSLAEGMQRAAEGSTETAPSDRQRAILPYRLSSRNVRCEMSNGIPSLVTGRGLPQEARR